MSIYGNSNETGKLLSLSGELFTVDPIQELLLEAEVEAFSEELNLERRRDMVLENHFPEQSMYILEKQLREAKESLARIKFYLGELEDILPH